MQPKLLLALPVLAICICTAHAQNPNGTRKAVPDHRHPQLLSLSQQKTTDLPYYYFDSTWKKVVRHNPGSAGYQPLTFPLASTGRAVKPPAASSFHLTRDINQLSESFPENNPANAPYSFAVLNQVSYFFADDGMHGRELWRSDGTANGTFLVKDINPGMGGSEGSNIIAANGILYFTAFSPGQGVEPWISDGTVGGTHLLKDVAWGEAHSFAGQFVDVNGTVFFSASNFGNNEQLWKTDGTELGTVMVKDLQQAGIGYRILELAKAGNLAYFIAFTWNTGFQLFRSDGTEWGTFIVREIGFNYAEATAPMQLTEYDGKLFFSAYDGFGRRLWTSDGSYEGTAPIPNSSNVLLQPDYLSVNWNHPFRILNGVLFLAGYTEQQGGGLYRFAAADPTDIVLVKDLTDIPDLPFDDIYYFVVPVDITVVNDALYFKVISTIGGGHDELWVSGGQEENTRLVKEFDHVTGYYTYNFFNGNGRLYFVVNNDPVYGTELWRSDGTEAGTMMVRDINVGRHSSFPANFTAANGKLLFRATTNQEGFELWTSDGTTTGTMLVKDINTITTKGSDAGFMYKGMGVTARGVVFNAFTNETGGELYASDGTAAGTVLLNDIHSGPDWSYPNYYLYKNGTTYFIGDDATGTAIYKTDGTPGGLRRVTAYINRDQYFVVNYNVTDKGLVLYTLAQRQTDALELWRSDGTQPGSFMLTPNLSYYRQNYIETIGNTAFFIAGDPNTGFELWKTDGTIAGTQMVKDINPGQGSSNPYSLFVYKNQLYFGAYDGFNINFHSSLWKSDGTERGTMKLKNLEPAFYDPYFNQDPQRVFCVSQGTLYFVAMDYNAYGMELWKTNGTATGTKLVKDIHPYFSSYPGNLTDVNGTLFFTADDGVHGQELWSTNGTEAGTLLVKDIRSGPDFMFGMYYCSAGGRLFFINTSEFPVRLWSSEGTAATTAPVSDAGLSDLLSFARLVPSGNKLFFGAYHSRYGTELYVGDLANGGFKTDVVQQTQREGRLPALFDATLYPNPVRSHAQLRLQGEVSSVTVRIVSASGKIVWRKSFQNQQTISLPVEKLSAGMYQVSLITDKGSRNLSLIKQ